MQSPLVGAAVIIIKVGTMLLAKRTRSHESGTPTIQPAERHRIAEIKWFDLNSLPEPIFPPIQTYLKALSSKKVYFE